MSFFRGPFQHSRALQSLRLKWLQRSALHVSVGRVDANRHLLWAAVKRPASSRALPGSTFQRKERRPVPRHVVIFFRRKQTPCGCGAAPHVLSVCVSVMRALRQWGWTEHGQGGEALLYLLPHLIFCARQLGSAVALWARSCRWRAYGTFLLLLLYWLSRAPLIRRGSFSIFGKTKTWKGHIFQFLTLVSAVCREREEAASRADRSGLLRAFSSLPWHALLSSKANLKVRMKERDNYAGVTGEPRVSGRGERFSIIRSHLG